MSFTLPAKGPQMNGFPFLRVPLSTITVAVAPRPALTLASMTEARTLALGLARSSRTSACKAISSNNSSIPSPVWAETFIHSVSPPISEGTSSCSINWVMTRIGSAAGRSILLIATMIVLPAAFACLIASSVCGIIPSSAATTTTTISVTSAPRERILEKMA